jgi:hypothetical protein
MPLFFTLISLVPCMVNLSFSVWVAWCFRRYPRPPRWIIAFLLIFGVGTLRLLFMGETSGLIFVLPTVLSAVLCLVHALALTCQRWLGFRVWKSWGISCLPVLPLVIWADLRFSVLVVDGNGKSVEVDTRRIEMQAMPGSIFYRGYGNRLKKGVVYFGFCQWVTHREKWLIWGDAVSPGGAPLRLKKIDCRANWENWPLRITVDAKTP